ncbi:MAG: RiPP maturation radical SAM C-methyltransferase [Thermodesulfobacteriota bacterium]
MLDLCLVNMPFCDLKRPSLALGLLQGILKHEGFAVRSVYANLLHTERWGPWAYLLATQSASRTLIGDWCFVDAAFPGTRTDHAAYLDYFCQVLESLHQRPSPRRALVEALMLTKQRCERFVEEMAERILAQRPRVVGCTSTFMQRMASLALLRRLRESAPYELVTLMGGANCEAEMGRATHRHFPWVDYVVSGEADDLIAPLMRLLLAKGRRAEAHELPEGVFGPAHRQAGYPALADGRVPRATAHSFAGQPPPDYADYFATLAETPCLKAALNPSLPLETSRGCWWGQKPGCRFCGLCGQAKTFRPKPVEQSLAAFKELIDRHGIRSFGLADNIMDLKYFRTLLPRLAAEPWARDCRFFFETRSALGPNQVAALRRAGVHYIQAGVESLHSRCLSLMNKGCQAWQNIQLLKWCIQYGVRVVWHILYDLPGEKDEWYQEMAGYLDLLHHLPPPNLFTFTKFDRFSAYHDNPEAYGLRLDPVQDHYFLYPIPDQGVRELAYDFDDRTRAAFRLNPMASLLRPQGQEAAREAYFAWRASWARPEGPPALVMREAGDALLITDTRAAAAAARHRLTGLDRRVYLAGQSAPLLAKLVGRGRAQGHDSDALREAVERLTANRLCLVIDDRLVSLATAPPEAPYPPLEHFPLGRFSVADFWRTWNARRGAAGPGQAQPEAAHA